MLYNTAGGIREVAFEPGQVNIITGASETGKSAVRGIIDYCLGSEECAIPGGAIRNTVLWYGLRLLVGDGEVFIARPDPGTKKTDTGIYYETGTEVPIPPMSRLRVIMNVETLIRRLTALVGIEDNLYVPDERYKRPPLEATIRHALWFCFLGQGEIANQHLLFHKQGEEHHAQALRDVLPYFLGATPGAVVSRRGELRQARAALKEVQRTLAERAAAAAVTTTEMEAMLAEAQAAGIVDASVSPKDAGVVRIALEAASRMVLAEDPGGGTNETYETLRRERALLDEQVRTVRAQRQAVRSLAQGQGDFVREASEQHERLGLLELFPRTDSDAADAPPHCPVCEQKLTAGSVQVADLRRALEDLSKQMQGVRGSRSGLDRHVADLDAKIEGLRQKIASNGAALQAVEAQDRQLSTLLASRVRQAVVVGRVSQFLEKSKPLVDDPTLELQKNALIARIDELEEELGNEGILERLASILNLLGITMTKWAKVLSLEHSASAQYRLDLQRLTVVADTRRGPLTMPNQGGAKNWLGCHLITYLTLQAWFSRKKRPVPGFLYLDQPTQISYPPERDADGSIDVLSDEGRKEVLAIFTLLFDVSRQLKSDLQIIIADHADIKTTEFESAVRARWRKGVKLIPLDWIENE